MQHEMTLEEWMETFKPMVAPEHVPTAGQLYLDSTDPKTDVTIESNKAGMDYLREVEEELPGRIWTVFDGDDGKLYIKHGVGYCNRMFYMVTEKPYDGDYIEILF